ncbi:MAG: hypothetical protein M1812_002136 [Candelaria pacifica]|nr:MAG: hypothetical protein M1812_002136 [Candelaria pacifica]
MKPAIIRSALRVLRPARDLALLGGEAQKRPAPRTSLNQPRRQIVSAAAVAESSVESIHDYPPAAGSLPGEPQPAHGNGGARRAEVLRDAKPFSHFLTDNFQRQHDYLRISITERCNLRCLYCMPEEGVPLSPPAHLLTTPEIFYLSSLFVSQGVSKIRLTGGEPTIRHDILPLMHKIGSLRPNGLRELCLTTNGISLHRKLDSMVEAGLTGVNLSLDTLDPFQFQIMTRRKGFEAVMKSIDRILELNRLGAGIKLKINCVVMRGINEREIIPFVEFGREKDIEVRFIEYMPFDGNKWNKGKMLSYQEMLEIIREKYPDLRKVQDHKNDTSKTFEVPGFRGRVGFITSMTHNFCGTCNRLRITSDGNLKVCLFGNAEVSLRDLLRKDNGGAPIDEEAFEALKRVEMDRRQALPGLERSLGFGEREAELLDVIGMAVKRKKEKHAGMGQLENMKNRPMILIADPKPRTLYRNPLTSPTSPWTTVHHYHLVSQIPSTSKRSFTTTFHRPQSNPEIPPLPSATLTHLTTTGTAHMVPISSKTSTHRTAIAQGHVLFSNPSPYRLIAANSMKKGDVLGVARIAGIMAAKKTSELIPLCHPIAITSVGVNVELASPCGAASEAVMNENEKGEAQDSGVGAFGGVRLEARVECEGKTGVEMEALTAVSVAGLTVYDMCKAVDKGIRIAEVRVVLKDGGKSGNWREKSSNNDTS